MTGFSSELLRLIGAKAGFDVRIELLPWVRDELSPQGDPDARESGVPFAALSPALELDDSRDSSCGLKPATEPAKAARPQEALEALRAQYFK